MSVLRLTGGGLNNWPRNGGNMKIRIIGFAALITLTAANVFAQVADGISFGAWGRGVFAPLVVFSDAINASGDTVKDHQNGNVFAGTGSTKANYGFEQEFYLTGAFNNVGFQFGLAFDGESVGGSVTSDRYWYNYLGAAIWVTPLGNEWLKVTGGTFYDDTLWGKIGETNDGFEEFVLPHVIDDAKGEDAIFTRFGGHYGKNLGFMLGSSPLEGLFIGARVNAPGLWGTPGEFNRADDVYRYIQVGAGYEIPGIGHARLQYLGGYSGKVSFKRAQKYIDDTGVNFDGAGNPWGNPIPASLEPNGFHNNPARMEAAFALTAVEGLLVDIGCKIYFPVTVEGKLYFPAADYQEPYKKTSGGFAVSAAAEYKFLNDFSITGRVDSAFGAYVRTAEGDKNYHDTNETLPTVDFRLSPAYNMGFAQVGLDFGFQMKGNQIDKNGEPFDPSKASSRWGIGAFIKRSFTNGHIKAGVTYTSPDVPANEAEKTRIAHKMIQIPVILEYSF